MTHAPRHFFGRVESLRGLAAGMVAFGHVLAVFVPAIVPLPGFGALKALGKGDNAVLMFFVISGFVLFFSLERLRERDNPILRFLVARVFRIYPAAMATVLLIALISAASGRPFQGQPSFDAETILKNLLLLRFNMNGVMWTLQVELVAAPIIVAAYYAHRRFGVGILWMLLAVFTALSFVGWFNRALGTPTLGLHAFIFGMILAAAGERWFAGLSRGAATWIFTAAACGFLASAPVLGWTSHWGTLVAIGFAGIMIALAAFKDVGPGLDSPVARFFGRISYGFYLLHPLTLFVLDQPEAQNVIGRLTAAGVPLMLLMIGTFLLSVAVVVPLAYLLLVAVEHPGIALGQRLFRKRLVTATG